MFETLLFMVAAIATILELVLDVWKEIRERKRVDRDGSKKEEGR